MIGLDIGISRSHKPAGGPSIIMAKNGQEIKLSVYVKSMPPQLLPLYQPFPIGGRFEQVSFVDFVQENL